MDSPTIRQESFIKYINCYGFAYIFDKRAIRYSIWINLLKVFGIVVPAVIGAVALSYKFEVLKFFIGIAIPITIIQFAISVCAVIFKWDDRLSYCYEASQHYTDLFSRYKTLNLSHIEADVNDSENKLKLLEVEYLSRMFQSTKQNIRDWEFRLGMRYALKNLKVPCSSCKKIPESMNPTDCDVCGNFPTNFKLLLS